MAQRGEEAEKGRTAKEEPDDSGTNGVPGFIRMAFGVLARRVPLRGDSGTRDKEQLVRVACIGGRCGWGKFEMHSLEDSLVSPAQTLHEQGQHRSSGSNSSSNYNNTSSITDPTSHHAPGTARPWGNMHHEDAVEFALDAAACSAATRTAVACTSPCAWCGALCGAGGVPLSQVPSLEFHFRSCLWEWMDSDVPPPGPGTAKNGIPVARAGGASSWASLFGPSIPTKSPGFHLQSHGPLTPGPTPGPGAYWLRDCWSRRDNAQFTLSTPAPSSGIRG
ncbi:hypothetical protein EDB80DRAFT_771133 [Ilyonectria destructans]|nr:hypothetical protein EDB80DRAFT_771133 [Ilyonectria destructans]